MSEGNDAVLRARGVWRSFREGATTLEVLTGVELVVARGERPVSYTHLDVYKRQVQAAPAPGGCGVGGQGWMEQSWHERKRRPRERKEARELKPVSYTHLDVYKRQASRSRCCAGPGSAPKRSISSAVISCRAPASAAAMRW